MKVIDMTKEETTSVDGVQIIFSDNHLFATRLVYTDGQVDFEDGDGDPVNDLHEDDIPKLIQALQLLQEEIA